MGRPVVGPFLAFLIVGLLGSGCGTTRSVPFEEARHRAFTQEAADASAREEFWALVGSDLPSFLPLLRQALREGPPDSGFDFEAGGFLLDHADGLKDLQIAVVALARHRPEEVPGGAGAYYKRCLRLAREPVDASAAILRVLRQAPGPDWEGRQGFRMAAGEAALRLFLTNGEDRWVPRLAQEVRTETDRPTAMAMVDCLCWAATPEADEALHALAAGTEGATVARTIAGLAPFLPGRAPLPRKTKMTRTREEFVRFLDAWDASGMIPPAFEAGGEPGAIDFLYLVEAGDADRIRSIRRRMAPLFGCASIGLEYLTVLLRRAQVLASSGSPPTPAVPPPAGR